MIRRSHLINKLREQNYRFKRSGQRVDIYKKKGQSQRVMLQRKKQFDTKTVRNLLRHCGCTEAEIEEFIGSCSN